jgi:hypothetical protein
MKKIIVIFSLISIISIVSARNIINYQEFNWKKVEKESYTVYFPEEMSSFVSRILPFIDSLNKVYEEKFFTYKDLLEYYEYRDTVKTDTVRDFFDFPFKEKSYKPKKLIILLYPNFEAFRQEKVLEMIIPPGLLGFMEIFNYRVCVPYLGDFDEFKSTLAHEIGHAWMFSFYQDILKRRLKIKSLERNPQQGYYFPLWFVEGFAQFVSYFMEDLESRKGYLRCLLEDLLRRDVTALTEPFKVLEKMEYEVYYAGASFMVFMAKRFSEKVFAELIIQTVLGDHPYHFYQAWEKVFKEKLEDSERKWWEYLKKTYYPQYLEYYSDSDLETYILNPPPIGFVTKDKENFLYYTENKKWGTEIVLKLGSTKLISLHHQFEDRTLWYRLDNKPFLSDSIAIFVTDKEGKEELNVFRIDLRKKKIKDFQVIRFENVYTINNPFLFENKVYFSGTNRNGQIDLYVYDLILKDLKRITDDPYKDDYPVLIDDSRILFLSDRFVSHGWGLGLIDENKVYKLYAYENEYVDQIVIDQDKNLVAFRVVSFFQPPRIFVMDLKNQMLYKVYDRFSKISQLIAIDKDEIYVLAERKVKKFKFKLENGLLIQPEIFEKEFTKTKEEINLKPIDRKIRYTSLAFDNFYLTDVTGEKRIQFNLGMAFRSGLPFRYFIYTQYQDLSKRTYKIYDFLSYQDFRIFFDLLHKEEMWVLDFVPFDLSFGFYHPIDFETAFASFVSFGYLKRKFIEIGSKEKISSFNLGFRNVFVKEAVFWGPKGTFLYLENYVKFGKNRQGYGIIEGYSLLDYRHYYQFGGSRVCFVSRVFLLRGVGENQFLYFDDQLYRELKVGSNADLIQFEFRFPILNFIAFQPSFFKKTDVLYFPIDGAFFWYTGDIYDRFKDRNLITRAGFAFKIPIAYFAFKLEYYKFIKTVKDLNFKNRKWTIAFEMEI